jgi:hypothetical protein
MYTVRRCGRTCPAGQAYKYKGLFMKKKVFLAGMLAMMLVWGFVVAGCDNDPEIIVTPFEGKWVADSGNGDFWQFAGTIFVTPWNAIPLVRGVFTYTATTLAVSITGASYDGINYLPCSDGPYAYSCSIAGNKLIIDYDDGGGPVPYTKQ